jgi:hypothetical protein
MATILLRVPVEAERGVVYDALATSPGVNGWWSNHTEGPDGVGSDMRVAFPDAPMTFDFEVVETKADPTRRRAQVGCGGRSKVGPHLVSVPPGARRGSASLATAWTRLLRSDDTPATRDPGD